MVLHSTEEGFTFVAWDGHVALLGQVVEVECETLVCQATGVEESGQVVNRDTSVGKTQNT